MPQSGGLLLCGYFHEQLGLIGTYKSIRMRCALTTRKGLAKLTKRA
jgi:hypothetical protein